MSIISFDNPDELWQEIDRLRAERNELRQEVWRLSTERNALAIERYEIRAQRDALAAALRGIMAHQSPDSFMELVHHTDCGCYDGMSGYTCDCGLLTAGEQARAALALLAADTAGEG